MLSLKPWLTAAKIGLSLAGFASQCFSADPIPPVPPDVPVASIVVMDAHGTPIVDEVGYSQQITISSSKAVHGKGPLSLAYLIEPAMQQFTIPVGTIDPNGNDIGGTVIATTPANDATIVIMQMVALGDKLAWQKIKIKCGTGSLPPPGPGPNPPVPPIPPVPTASHLFLAVVNDTVNTPADALPVLNAITVWNSFRESGNDWRFYDPKTGETKGKKAVADALKANIPPPALVTYNLDTGSLISVTALPKTIVDLKASVAKNTGAK